MTDQNNRFEASTRGPLVQAIEENRFQAFSSLGQVAGGEVRDDVTMLRVRPGESLPPPLSSWVLRARLTPDREESEIEQTVHYFRQRDLPFAWLTSPSTRPTQLGQRLEQHGFIHLLDLAGMALDLTRASRNAIAPRDLEVQVVETEDALSGWTRAFCAGFSLAEDTQERVHTLIRRATMERPVPWRHYIGRQKGEVVASTSMYLAAGVAGIYFVATIPRARRQGIAKWMISTALSHAREEGYSMSVLHAARTAQTVYQGLGFEEYCALGIYVWTPNEGSEGT